ncbi:MAG: sigma-70 family RNA polymerase sigma factor [Candidatus Riflebacteria bacterium]|nr:sigma-70 family RNA polymerase sigma factor [Candidatus Riflebacteria bacterium]
MASFPDKDAEQQLIAETLDGSSGSFKPLVEKYWGLVSSIIQKYIKNRETAADITQEAFLAAYTSLGQYKHEHSFSPWLAKIAVNKALEHLRREKRSPFTDFDLATAVSSRLSPESAIDERQLFDECLACLPDKLQVLFILRHGLEFSYEDMAYVLDLPVGSIKSIMFRMRNQLKEILESRNRCENAQLSKEQECDVK